MNSLIALIIATSVLVLIPGPNVALIVANSLKHGLRSGIVTVAGTTAGLALQLVLVVAGMAALIELAANALAWVKWAGVAYLLWLGIRTWREPASDLSEIEPARVLFWRGVIVAALNPKTLLFNAAFIPQFVADPSADGGGPVLVAAVFLFVVFAGDVLWAAFASSASRYIGRFASWRNRLTGAFLATAAVGLALSRR